MKTLYLDIFSGISGDMFIGAMIDLGVDFAALDDELAKLDMDGYHLHVKHGQKSHIKGTKFDVHLSHDDHGHSHSHSHSEAHSHGEGGHSHSHAELHSHSHTHEQEHSHGRNYKQIKQLITRSKLSDWVKQKSIAIFHRIAVAEGAIHGMPPEEVHFHEVGAVDSIVDIVGACIALELLGKPRVLSAAPVEGTGWINCAHGRFPIPAPATLSILGARGIGLTQCEEPNELITPTGAAILAELVEHFGPMQNLVASEIGFGLGTRDNKTRPNVLRAILGETGTATDASAANDWETDSIAVLETNLDDINSEILGNFLERALAAGALDVFHTSIQMKKNRPGVLLTVLCVENQADKFSEMILRETTAYGVRRTIAERKKLQRELIKVSTDVGEIIVKLGRLNGKVIQATPEYESCKAAAEKAGVPVKTVYEKALLALKSR
jgi:uncharacterized protein (TIGR00299 family) protein